MKAKKKIFIKRMSNLDSYNELDIEKSEIFLNNIQDFVVNIGLAKISKGEYEINGKSYDVNTYYTLFYEDPKDDLEMRKLKIDEFGDGKIARYFNKEIELLIIFLKNRIKLIFYCDKNKRERIINSLLKFCKIMKVKS